MRKIVTMIFLALISIHSASGEVILRDERGFLFEGATVSGSRGGGSDEYVENELLLGIDPELFSPTNSRGEWDGLESLSSPALRRVLEDNSARGIRRVFSATEFESPGDESDGLNLRGFIHVRFSRGVDVLELAREIRQLPGVKFVEPNWYIDFGEDFESQQMESPNEGHDKSFPNDTSDTYWDNQWNLNSTVSDYSINASEAWAYSTGDPGVIIGAVEGRIDSTHVDLDIDGGIHFHWVEDPWGGDPYFEIIPLGSAPAPNGYRDHATQAAGIIRASTNNNIGVAGIAGGNGNSSGCSLYNIQIDNPENIAVAAAALEYAANPNELGCDILSCSWRVPGYCETLRGALAYCNSVGANVVTGNGYSPYFAVSDSMISMGGLDYSWVTTVGIYGTDGQVCDDTGFCPFYSWSSKAVDILAPGIDLPTPSTVVGEGYDPGEYYSNFLGCSGGIPHVSATIGLLRSYMGNDLRPEDYDAILKKSSRDVVHFGSDGDSLTWHNYYGYGCLDAGKALAVAAAGTLMTFTGSGGSFEAFTDTIDLEFKGGPFIKGLWKAIPYRVTKYISFNGEFSEPPIAWGVLEQPFPYTTYGLSGANPNYATPFTCVYDSTVTTSGCYAYTFVYKLIDRFGNAQWYPTYPTGVPVAVKTLGNTGSKKKRITNLKSRCLVGPNPFNGKVNVSFIMDTVGEVSVGFVDVRGRRVRDFNLGEFSPGPVEISWDGRDMHGRDLPSGLYFLVVKAGNTTIVDKVTLVK